MENITFETLPAAVTKLLLEMETLKSLITGQRAEPSQSKDIFLTIPEAALFLDLAQATIYAKVGQREIPHCKRGKRLYFLKSDLENYLKEGRKKTATEIHNEAEQHLLTSKKRLNYGK